MNKFRILLLGFLSPFIISCSAQKSKDITLEGKWEVVNWTYVSEGSSFDEEEKQWMNKTVENLIFDFKPNKIISTNKPEEFKDLEGEEFTVNINNSIMVNHQLYDFFIRDDKCFFVFSNIIFQIKK